MDGENETINKGISWENTKLAARLIFNQSEGIEIEGIADVLE